MKYTPTQTQAAVTSGMANLNLAPPPPTNAAVNVNPPPPMFAPQNFALNPGHMPIPAVSILQNYVTFSSPLDVDGTDLLCIVFNSVDKLPTEFSSFSSLKFSPRFHYKI